MGGSAGKSMEETVQQDINTNPVVIYSMTTCPYCDRVKDLFNRINVPYVSFEMNHMQAGGPMFEAVRRKTGLVTVPQVFICGEFRGGFTDVAQLHNAGQLQELINQCTKRLHY